MHTCWHPNPKNSVLNQTPLPFREELGGWVVFHTFLSLGIIWRQAEQETPGLRGTSELFLYTLPVGKCHLFHPSEKHLCMCEMFACELFSLSTVVILLQIPKKSCWTKQKTTVAEPPPPAPRKHIYDTYTSRRPTLSAATNISRVPSHHPLLYASSPPIQFLAMRFYH